MRPMASISSISLSGMQAAQTRLQASAHNIANAQTQGFQRQQVVQQEQAEGGTTVSMQRAASAQSALETDVVQQLEAKNSFLANLAVYRTSNRMLGVLFDEKV
jgi:flagellar hook-associated protein FlgK